MNLSEYFNKGRQQEQEHARRKLARQPQRRNTKLPWYSPAGILVGAGVLYQMVLPILTTTVIPVVGVGKRFCRDTIAVMKSDVKIVAKKVTTKVDPDWEEYKNFLELCRGKK